MFGRKQNKPKNRIDSLIGSELRIDGNIGFAGGLRVDGQINGNVVASTSEPCTLVVSEHGRINGDVVATHMVVNGTIEGQVRITTEYLELQSKARVIADVHYKTLEIQLGAIVDGRLIHTDEVASDKDKVVAFKLNSME